MVFTSLEDPLLDPWKYLLVDQSQVFDNFLDPRFIVLKIFLLLQNSEIYLRSAKSWRATILFVKIKEVSKTCTWCPKKKVLIECCWSHGAPVQSPVAGTPWAWKMFFARLLLRLSRIKRSQSGIWAADLWYLCFWFPDIPGSGVQAPLPLAHRSADHQFGCSPHYPHGHRRLRYAGTPRNRSIR